MKKIILCALLLLNLSSTVSIATSAEDVALTLVQKYSLGQRLTPISYEYATQSQTYRMIINKVGEENAKNIVNTEIDKLVPEYQEQWNTYLASSYAEVLSVEKLQSLVDKGSLSEYSTEFKEKGEEIGQLMYSKSYDLLTDLMTKALIAAFDKMVQ
jgi:Skp family chaperone for outer membrane proteins